MANFIPLTAEIGLPVWGTPANFNRFHVLASLLQRRRPQEVNQTARSLAVSWAGTLYIHFLGLAPWRKFATCKIHFATKSCVLLYWQRYCTALQQRAAAKLCGMVQRMKLRNFRRKRHLYLPGRPSRWALAHILVCEDVAWRSCAMLHRWRIFGDFLSPVFSASRVQHISDLHPNS